MFRSVGRAGRVFVTTASAVWFRGRSPMDRSHSICLPMAIFSYAAHNRLATLSLICEGLGGVRSEMLWHSAAPQSVGWLVDDRAAERRDGGGPVIMQDVDIVAEVRELKVKVAPL